MERHDYTRSEIISVLLMTLLMPLLVTGLSNVNPIKGLSAIQIRALLWEVVV